MAQLRDAKTSEIIAEGTPLALVFLADELGQDNVLYDGVGLAFDPDAVRAAYESDISGLESVTQSTDADDVPRETWEAAKQRLKELKDEAARSKKAASDVERVQKAAQDPDSPTPAHVVVE